ncbi:hypothetical protein [Acidovorax sp. Leaf78]|uniref:hypothetical protein n=1 Tax=Acidovorax sp. Leaf78 TaxID=1736237 RepID=UPI000A7F8439|nr:hypothetical protein [Acidovorax sp. Leaf78]
MAKKKLTTKGVALPGNPDGMPLSELLALLENDSNDEHAQTAILDTGKILFSSSRRKGLAAWKTLGTSITAAPKTSLAAWLGHRDSIAALERQGLAVPHSKIFARDPQLKSDPHGLGLSVEQKATDLFVRCVAFWGAQSIQRAALACAELQFAARNRAPAALLVLRNAAMAAARNYIACPGDATRLAAVQASEACWQHWEKHRNPDSAAARATWEHLGAPWFAATLAGDAMDLTEYDGPPPRVASSTWGARSTSHLNRAAEAAGHWTSPAEALRAMQEALLAWALSDAPEAEFT